MALLVIAFIVAWRMHPRHPILLMALVMTLLVWQDPIMNWAPYAVYNPQLWHWPETWGLVSLSPTVEPFIVIGYATFYMAPFFPAIWILRRLQARRPTESFVWRHPLISLSVLIFAIGFVFDSLLEMFLIRTQLYIYSQVIPFGSFAVGKWYQFPLIWEASLVTLVMIPAGVLLYRDDTGRTQAEKLALRIRAFRVRPALGTFVVMFAIINVAYFCYGGGYASSAPPGQPLRWRARGPFRKPRCTTPTASTRPRASRVLIPAAFGRVGRAANPMGGRTTRCPRKTDVVARMDSGRSVVVTGASRGLGLATAAYLHRAHWTVVAAMRSPEEGMKRLRALTGSDEDDPRLVGVRLDLDDSDSIKTASESILDLVGAPYGLVHNAGIAGVGSLEEMPVSVWEQIFSTNFFGPMKLTKRLLPSMRKAGGGRIVMISSAGAIRGMPAIGAYSAAKGALERWAESLSQEVAPFGVGVSVLVAGTFRTDILELTTTYADYDGPYGQHHANLEKFGNRFLRFASSPGAVRACGGQSPRGPTAVRSTRHWTGCSAPHDREPVAPNQCSPTNHMSSNRHSCRGLPARPSAADDSLREHPNQPRGTPCLKLLLRHSSPACS